jgi:HD-like signal output (HDOD) protein
MTADTQELDRNAERVVKDIGIPPCPAILSELMVAMRADDPDYRRISNLISSDAALASAVIATVNSAFYGLATKATTVRDACLLLGLRSTALLVTGLLFRRAFPTNDRATMNHYWALSSATAWNAAMIARTLRVADRDSAHTYGLFRDCGLAVLLPCFPDYKEIMNYSVCDGETPLTQIEDERYAINHARAGYLLAQSWQLPAAMCEAILHHHDYVALNEAELELSQETRRLIAVGFLAEQLHWTERRGGPCPEWELGRTFTTKELGIGENDVPELVETLKRQRAHG